MVRKVRIDDCEALGRITVDASLTTFADVIPAELLDLTWAPADSAAGWRRTLAEGLGEEEHFLVAEEAGVVVAFVWAVPAADTPGYDAAVRGLYVLPARQRSGIGRRLLGEAVRRLRDAGVRSVEIGCIRENPSCGFYRRMGGVEIGRRPERVDGYNTEEILFGWQDLDQLTGSLS